MDHPAFSEVTDTGEQRFNPFDIYSNKLDLTTINTTLNEDEEGKAKKFGGALEHLLKARNSSTTRKINNEALVAEGLDQLAIQARVQRITSVTSGKMTSNNIFCISNKHVQHRLQTDWDKKEQKNSEVQGRKEQQKTKNAQKFQNAAKKYFTQQNLLSDDLKILLKEISYVDDSPIKKKVDDLRIQFENRKIRIEK